MMNEDTPIHVRLDRIESLHEMSLSKITRVEEIMQQLWDGFSALKDSPMLAALIPQPRKKK
jgi:hypothetical protein